jgi:hypothetical protein
MQQIFLPPSTLLAACGKRVPRGHVGSPGQANCLIARACRSRRAVRQERERHGEARQLCRRALFAGTRVQHTCRFIFYFFQLNQALMRIQRQVDQCPV